MAIVSTLQVLYRRKDDILFGWNPLKKSEAKSYNIYSSSASGGPFTLVKSKIQNEVDRTDYRGKVVCLIKDSEIPIPENFNIPPVQGGEVRGTTWWFKLTFVDLNNIESNIAISPAIVVRPANVEPFFENENEVQNDHNFGWVDSRHRWEKFLLNDNGELKVDAVVNIDEITLGNVKVAARPDGTTLEYIFVDNNRKLVVRIDPNSISRVDDYETKLNVVKNIETIILTYTNVSPFFVEKIVCGGTGDAVFNFKIDGSTRQTRRTSWNRRDITFDFSTIARKVPGSSTVTITAKHSEKNNQNFEASLNGFTFTI